MHANPAAVPAILDLEASGFGRHSYPIEAGYVPPDGRSCCTLIRPEPDWTHWDAGAEQVHGISRDTLQRHGCSAAEVARLLNEALDGQVVDTDDWAHDYPEDWDDAKQKVSREAGTRRHRASQDARLLQMTWRRVRP